MGFSPYQRAGPGVVAAGSFTGGVGGTGGEATVGGADAGAGAEAEGGLGPA